MESGKRTPEYRKILDNYAKICSTLTDHVPPGSLGNKLLQAHLIGGELKRFANREIRDEEERINRLLGAVHNQIELNSANFYKFIKILEEYEQLEKLLELLKLDATQQEEKQSEETSKPPQITLQPTSKKDILPGNSTIFTIEAIGTQPIYYQWQWKPAGKGVEQDEWQNLMVDGTTFQEVEAGLKLAGVQAYHAGDYRCIVSNSAGSEMSESARLTVAAELADLVNELHEVNDWVPFGLLLGIKMPKLEAIRRDYPTIGDRRTQMLYAWQNNVIPTWSAVVQALSGIGMRRLASELAQKHGIVPDLKEQYLARNGNADTASVTPSTSHHSSTSKYVPAYRASSRDGLRSTAKTSSDLETQEKRKFKEATPKTQYCPSWKWRGIKLCFAVGVAAVLIGVVRLNPDVINYFTSIGPTVPHNSRVSPGDVAPGPSTKGPPVDCHKITDKQELRKAVATIGNWETLCENLGAPEPILKQLCYANMEIETKRSRCLEAYLNTGKACWETVVQVVADDPFYNKKLAEKIANEYGVDYSSIVKEEL